MSRWNMTVPANLDTDTLVVVSEIADQLIQTYQVCQKSGYIYMSVKYANKDLYRTYGKLLQMHLTLCIPDGFFREPSRSGSIYG